MNKLKIMLFYILSFTWGIIMSLIGLLAFISLIIAQFKPKVFHHIIYFEVGHNWGGVNLGCFFIVSCDSSYRTLQHEAGHAIQNIMLGILFPFIIAIPSVIRYWYRELKYNRRHITPPTRYDAIWFESWATKIGIEKF